MGAMMARKVTFAQMKLGANCNTVSPDNVSLMALCTPDDILEMLHKSLYSRVRRLDRITAVCLYVQYITYFERKDIRVAPGNMFHHWMFKTGV